MDIHSKIKRLKRQLCCCRRCVTHVTGNYNSYAPVSGGNIPRNCVFETKIFIGGIQIGSRVLSSQGDPIANYITQLNAAFMGLATFWYDEPSQTMTASFITCANYTMECSATCDR